MWYGKHQYLLLSYLCFACFHIRGGEVQTDDPDDEDDAVVATRSTKFAASITTTTVTVTRLQGTTPPAVQCAKPCPTRECTKNAFSFGPSGEILAPSIYGEWNTTCGRQYLVSYDEMNADEAYTFCCTLGLSLLSADTLENWNCARAMVKRAYEMWGNEVDPGSWVNAENTKYCAPAKYRWCPSNVGLWTEPSLRYTDKKETSNSRRCVTFHYSSSKSNDSESLVEDLMGRDLVVLPCDWNQRVVCESYTTTTPSPIENATTCQPVCPKTECTTEKTRFTKNGLLKNASSFGQWILAGEKLYLFSKFNKNQMESSEFCCSIGGGLVSLTSVLDSVSISAVISQLDLHDIRFWTSGSCAGCDITDSVWCPSRQRFGSVIWYRAVHDQNQGFVYAVIMKKKSDPGIKFTVTISDERTAFICQASKDYVKYLEFNVPTLAAQSALKPLIARNVTCIPFCPAWDCVKDVTLFDGSGVLINHLSYGMWSECAGRQYLQSSRGGLSQEEAHRFCCSLGMELISVTSSVKPKCLKFLEQRLAFNAQSKIVWTSANARGCSEGVFLWCSGQGGPSTLVEENSEIPWTNSALSPSTSERQECAILSMQMGGLASPLKLKSTTCNSRNYALCVGLITSTPQPTTCLPQCLNLNASSLLQTWRFEGPRLKNASSYGVWFTKGGRLYLFSTAQKVSQVGATIACARIGMQLLSLDSSKKIQVVTQIFSQQKSFKDTNFWTSASNWGCDRTYVWCSSNVTFSNRGIFWGSTEPNNFDSLENCVLVSYNGNLWVADIRCSSMMYYICEGPPTPAPPTG